MQTPDLINGAFELLASGFVLNHTRALWVSRQPYGISLLSTVFFMLWGCWNVWYYPAIGQELSFYAGIAVLLANIFWVWSILHLRRVHPENLSVPGRVPTV